MLCAWEAWTRTAVNEKINISFASASLRAERTADNKREHHDANLRASRTAYGPAPTGGIGDCSARVCKANAGGLRRDRSAGRSAFAAVRREAYLGPGPWPTWYLFRRGYVATPSDDPVYLYQDALVGIIPDRGVNNGQPSLYAMLIAAAAPQPGEHVVHIGAGVGILAHTVGESGRVTAI